MDKTKIIALCCLVCVIAALIMGSTVTDKPRSRWSSSIRDSSVLKSVQITETDGDVNDFLTEVPQIANTVVERIVVDANGTDTSFKIHLWDAATTYGDANGVKVFTKTDFTTASAPYSYSLVMSDVDSQETRGIPMSNSPYLELADGDDATMACICVIIYYRQEWQ